LRFESHFLQGIIMTRSFLTCCTVLGFAAGCSQQPVAPAALQSRAALSANVAENDKPNFNLEVILRAPDGASGFGHVKFRQDNDDAERIDLGVWVRDLAPNAHYRLQRAVDTVVDDNCTSEAWLTLGEGTTPQDVITDDQGTAKQDLFRVIASPRGTAFDIHFRVLNAAGEAVLASDCYQFFAR